MIKRSFQLCSQYPEILVSVFLGFCCIILGLQSPFLYFSPDVTLYSSSIIRAMNNDLFVDPFSGTHSILPAFFGFFWGIFNSAFHVHIVRLLWVIEIFDFIGFFVLFWAIAYSVSENHRVASLATLASGLLLYYPNGRYFLLPSLFNFGLLFILASILFFILYVKNKNLFSLILFFFFSGFAIATWWYFFIVPLALVISNLVVGGHRVSFLKSLCCSVIGCIPPGLFIGWHLFTIRNVIPLYAKGNIGSTFSFQQYVWHNFQILLTKGNLPVTDTYDLLPGVLYIFNTFIGSIIYNFLVIPSSLLLLILPLYIWWNSRSSHGDGKHDVQSLLILSGYVIILLSFIIDPANMGRVERNQFMGYVFLSLPAFIFLFSREYQYQNIIRSGLIICSVLIITYTCFHSIDGIITENQGFVVSGELYQEQKIYSELDIPVIEFIHQIPDLEKSRIFISNTDVMILSPQVAFNSFFAHRDGIYTNQDPVTATDLGNKFKKIRDIESDWRKVMEQEHISYLIFSTNMNNYDQVRYYLSHGQAVFSNDRWIIIDMTKEPVETVELVQGD